MNKKSNQPPPAPAKQPLWLWIAGGAAIVLIMIGLALWWSSTGATPTAPAQTGSDTPQLVVDRTTIDDGEVKFNTPIQATFKLSNTGSQPLQIVEQPKVELIEGC